MLLILMYHRVANTRFPVADQALYRHFSWLKDNFQIVLPGERIQRKKPAVCLTFDDAYFDFYCRVFPLLQELKISAVLAVPTKFILESTLVNEQQRLQVTYDQAMQGDIYQRQAPFCTWEELKILHNSGLVKIASHSHSHVNFTKVQDLTAEIVYSKELLTKKLTTKIDTFVYPYGQVNKQVHKLATQHYRYAMRIGSALNFSWGQPGQMLYRIDAEHFWPQVKSLSVKNYLNYGFKYLANRIRGK